MISIHYSRYEQVQSERHSWLRVPLEHLAILGLLKRISPFSKREGRFVWLEQTLDGQRFKVAFEWYTGNKLETTGTPKKVEHERVSALPAYFP